MTQSFRCTNCAAPLEIEDALAHIIRCEYCGVASELFGNSSSESDLSFNFGGADLLEQARRLKEIKQLALAGNTINAIKLYRDMFGVGLAEAKKAVENIQQGKPPVFTNIQSLAPQNFPADNAEALGQSLKMAQIHALLQSGNKIEAIKIYRETFGTGLKEAKDAVDAMERGGNLSFAQTTESLPMPNYVLNQAKRNSVRSFQSKIFGLTIFLFVAGIAAAFFINGTTGNDELSVNDSKPMLSVPRLVQTEENAGIAREVFKFGGEGTGAGRFEDNRVIALDGAGRIYSADMSGGRIQIFDPQGKFQTQVMADTAKTVDEIAVDRRGNLFVLQGYDLHRFELNNVENHSKTRIDYASDMAIGLDGKLYVASRRGGITVLSPEGKILRKIQTENTGLRDIASLAMDGAGNFYAIDGDSFSVFKLSPEGKFITRFGGKSSGRADKIPAGLFSGRPHDIAVDAAGRVYVSQIVQISVFDKQGVFIGDIKTTQAFGMAFSQNGELFVATRPFVTKYAILK